VRWAVRDALHDAQNAIDQVLSNFPVKPLARFLRFALFPLGMPFRPPLDARNKECAKIALEPGAARDRLTRMVFVSKSEQDPTGQLEAAFHAAIACEPIDKKLREAVKAGRIVPHPSQDLSVLARDAGVITAEETAQWQRKEALRRNVIKVDDFPQDYGRAEALQKLAAEKPVAAMKAA
jgi:acyl-CoA dehydrogenase